MNWSLYTLDVQRLFLFYFILFFMATSTAYGGLQARDWIQASAEGMLDPLTHWAGLGIEPTSPQQPEPLQLDS